MLLVPFIAYATSDRQPKFVKEKFLRFITNLPTVSG